MEAYQHFDDIAQYMCPKEGGRIYLMQTSEFYKFLSASITKYHLTLHLAHASP